jgi:hypothetical protein
MYNDKNTCILLPSYWWHTFIIKILHKFYVFMWWTCMTCFFILRILHVFHMYFFNFGLGIIFYYHFIFNEVSIYIMVSFLSLFCDMMYLCTWVVNLLLLAPDDDTLRVETCSAFLYFYQYTFFKRWYVRQSYRPLSFDLPPQDAFLQDIHNRLYRPLAQTRTAIAN